MLDIPRNMTIGEFLTLICAIEYGFSPSRVGLPEISKDEVNSWITESVAGKNILPEDAISIFWAYPEERNAWHTMIISQTKQKGETK